MGKENIVEIPEGSGNKYKYAYEGGRTAYLGPVGSSPSLSEAEFLKHIEVESGGKKIGLEVNVVSVEDIERYTSPMEQVTMALTRLDLKLGKDPSQTRTSGMMADFASDRDVQRIASDYLIMKIISKGDLLRFKDDIEFKVELTTTPDEDDFNVVAEDRGSRYYDGKFTIFYKGRYAADGGFDLFTSGTVSKDEQNLDFEHVDGIDWFFKSIWAERD